MSKPTTTGGSNSKSKDEKAPGDEMGAAGVPAIPSKEPPPLAGGVEINVTEPLVSPIEKDKEELLPQPGKKTEAELKAAKIALDKMLIGLGALAAMVTGMEEMKFNAEERDLLAEVWAPFLPPVPAITMAALVTITIVGGKVSLYVTKHKKKKPGKPEEPKDPIADIPAKDLPEEIRNAG